MDADRPGTLRTAWAACCDDADRLHVGDTRDEAIGEAAIAREEEAECDGRDVAWPVGVTVYRDVLWCTGEADDDTGECPCGASHDDYPWVMMRWAERERTTTEAPVWVARGVPDGR